MKKKCVLYKSSELYPRHVCLDAETAEEILSFTDDPKIKKKFDYIVNRILNQDFIYYDDYVKLIGYDHLAEMRIFPNGLNARIYCKEESSTDGNYYIVAAKLLPKKTSEKIDKAIDQLIKPIQKYEYEFEGIAGQNPSPPSEQN
jgi:hypothetical protein